MKFVSELNTKFKASEEKNTLLSKEIGELKSKYEEEIKVISDQKSKLVLN